MEELLKLASNYGFPMIVAFYSLIRLESTIKANTKVMIAIAAKLGVGVSE